LSFANLPVGEVLLTGSMAYLLILICAKANGCPFVCSKFVGAWQPSQIEHPLAIAGCNLSNFSPTSYASRRAAEFIQCDKNG
jgi:hypothetical protein